MGISFRIFWTTRISWNPTWKKHVFGQILLPIIERLDHFEVFFCLETVTSTLRFSNLESMSNSDGLKPRSHYTSACFKGMVICPCAVTRCNKEILPFRKVWSFYEQQLIRTHSFYQGDIGQAKPEIMCFHPFWIFLGLQILQAQVLTLLVLITS